MSLGTGQKTPTPIENADDFDIATAMENAGEFLVDIDMETADWWLKTEMVNPDENYYRAQTTSSVELDDTSVTSDETTLPAEGEDMWQDNQTQIQKMIERIMDEKFKPVPPPTQTTV